MWWIIVGILGIVVIFLILYVKSIRDDIKHKEWRERVDERINNGEYWEGMDSWMLEHSLGKPNSIEVKEEKEFKREIWEYDKGLKFTLEGELVVGWEGS